MKITGQEGIIEKRKGGDGMDRKQQIRDLLFRTEMTRRKKLYPVWNRLGLIAGQPRVLSQLLIREHITQKELADASCIEPATLSRALDRLEDMGYIARNDNPNCRRSFLVSLTEEGRKMAGEVQEVFGKTQEVMVEGFSQEEQETLCRLLERVYKNLNQNEK